MSLCQLNGDRLTGEPKDRCHEDGGKEMGAEYYRK